MAKITAWLVTIIGVILVLKDVLKYDIIPYGIEIIALAVLVIGITKLMRNYSKKRR